MTVGKQRVRTFERLESRDYLNADPVAVDDRLIITADETVQLDTLLTNDSDPDNDALSMVSYTLAENGLVTFVRGTGYTYTPDLGFVGSDSFTYTISDGQATTEATVVVDVHPVIDAAAVRSALLAGVSSVADAGSPGRMVAYGPTTVTVAEYPNDPQGGPMIAAATWGQGRVVAMPDHQWLRMGAFGDTGDTGQFYLNGIEWLTGTTDKGIKIVMSDSSDSQTELWLESQGYTNVVRVANYTPHLADADLLVGWLQYSNSESKLDAIADFVEGGGGLFVAEYGQGYQGYNNWWPEQVDEVDANRLLRDVGFGFSGGSRSGANLSVAAATEHYNAEFILNTLESPGNFTIAQRAAANAQLARLAEILPDDDTLQAELLLAVDDAFAAINPTPATPVSNLVDQSLLELEMQLIQDLPPEQVTAHRTAEAVYGPIPAGAERVSQLPVTLDTTQTGWLPTGLYAVPGEIVTIELLPSLVGQGYHVQISGHVDNISNRSSWLRVPYGVDRRFEITSTTMQVASAFGGAIYVDVGDENAGDAPSTQPTDIEVTGAIRALLCAWRNNQSRMDANHPRLSGALRRIGF